ncbi:MAG: hypothetical protein JW867_03310 [Candidatus Omnitrophica bacterium]|nr:hypothetical protein [Candidatus Omnitrophota bacterium]
MKSLSILIVALLAVSPLFAGELTNDEMADIYAGKITVDINEVAATNSAVAAQSNLAAIVSNDDIERSDISNANIADVTNEGAAALALQSNIGVAASFGGCYGDSCYEHVIGADIKNANTAEVENKYVAGNITTTGSSVDVNVNGDGGSINASTLKTSAVASQSNIGIVAALAGDVKYSDVINKNTAIVVNKPK